MAMECQKHEAGCLERGSPGAHPEDKCEGEGKGGSWGTDVAPTTAEANMGWLKAKSVARRTGLILRKNTTTGAY